MTDAALWSCVGGVSRLALKFAHKFATRFAVELAVCDAPRRRLAAQSRLDRRDAASGYDDLNDRVVVVVVDDDSSNSSSKRFVIDKECRESRRRFEL